MNEAPLYFDELLLPAPGLECVGESEFGSVLSLRTLRLCGDGAQNTAHLRRRRAAKGAQSETHLHT